MKKTEDNIELKRQRPENPVILAVIHEKKSRPPAEETDFNLPIGSPADPQIRSFQS